MLKIKKNTQWCFGFISQTQQKNSKLFEIYSDVTVWCKVQKTIKRRSAASLQMSVCLPRRSAGHFSHTVCGPFHTTAQRISRDPPSIMNTSQPISKQTNTRIALNALLTKRGASLKPCCYIFSLNLHPLSIKNKTEQCALSWYLFSCYPCLERAKRRQIFIASRNNLVSHG